MASHRQFQTLTQIEIGIFLENRKAGNLGQVYALGRHKLRTVRGSPKVGTKEKHYNLM